MGGLGLLSAAKSAGFGSNHTSGWPRGCEAPAYGTALVNGPDSIGAESLTGIEWLGLTSSKEVAKPMALMPTPARIQSWASQVSIYSKSFYLCTSAAITANRDSPITSASQWPCNLKEIISHRLALVYSTEVEHQWFL